VLHPLESRIEHVHSCTCAAVLVLVQDIFNLLPNMNVEALSTSLAVKGNDMMAVIYLASLIRRCDICCSCQQHTAAGSRQSVPCVAMPCVLFGFS
jgi:hypothetical protein